MTRMTSDLESPEIEILKTDRLGRVQRSREEVDTILDAFEASAMSGAEFARQHGLNYPSFASWRSRRRKEQKRHADQSDPQGSSFTFFEVAAESCPQDSITIEFADQIKLKVATVAQVKIASALIREMING